MVMKSIFTVSCFIVMALAIETEEWKRHPRKLIHLIEDMNTTCHNLMNGTCQRVNEVVFKINCEEEVYQDTFCQVDHALLSCKDYNLSSALSAFHDDKCTSKESFIRLKDFCSKMLFYFDRFYRRCAIIKSKGF